MPESAPKSRDEHLDDQRDDERDNAGDGLTREEVLQAGDPDDQRMADVRFGLFGGFFGGAGCACALTLVLTQGWSILTVLLGCTVPLVLWSALSASGRCEPMSEWFVTVTIESPLGLMMGVGVAGLGATFEWGRWETLLACAAGFGALACLAMILSVPRLFGFYFIRSARPHRQRACH